MCLKDEYDGGAIRFKKVAPEGWGKLGGKIMLAANPNASLHCLPSAPLGGGRRGPLPIRESQTKGRPSFSS